MISLVPDVLPALCGDRGDEIQGVNRLRGGIFEQIGDAEDALLMFNRRERTERKEGAAKHAKHACRGMIIKA